MELAQNYFGNTRSGSLAGPVGAFLIAALAVGTILLIRSMNRRIRRLPDRFPGQEAGPGPIDQKQHGDGNHAQDSAQRL